MFRLVRAPHAGIGHSPVEVELLAQWEGAVQAGSEHAAEQTIRAECEAEKLEGN